MLSAKPMETNCLHGLIGSSALTLQTTESPCSTSLPSTLSLYKRVGSQGVNNTSVSTATPHGIKDILGGPPALHGNLAAGFPAIRAVSAHPALLLGATHSVLSASDLCKVLLGHPSENQPLDQTSNRLPLLWPGMLAGSMWSPAVKTQLTDAHAVTGDGDSMSKKKQTRPTFSGQQIFALEKTFEQTKYLAGPERARLAYSLGMSESQVKVWFQNRRTKWRKKHAAELATAKRRQDCETARLHVYSDAELDSDSDYRPLEPQIADTKLHYILGRHHGTIRNSKCWTESGVEVVHRSDEALEAGQTGSYTGESSSESE